MAQKENRRKVRAILAGGLVLGIGAAATLAAWNSSEFATGFFNTGAFELEGSLDGTEYINHPDTEAAQLRFPVDAGAIAAEQSINAPFAVQLSATTTEDATVALETNASGIINGLSYKVYKTVAFGCEDLTTPFAAGAFDGNPVNVPAFELTHGDGIAGPSQNLCFVVSADANLEQGAESTAVWEFVADQKN